MMVHNEQGRRLWIGSKNARRGFGDPGTGFNKNVPATAGFLSGCPTGS